MKILIFSETYLPTVNGVVQSIELFRHELERRGHTVYIVAPHSSNEEFKAREHVFRLLSIPFIGQPSHPVAWPYLSQVESIVDEIKPDIIHIQGMFSTSILGKRIARKKHLPHVLTYHTHLEGYAHYAGPLAIIARPLLRLWALWFTRNFDLVITPTPSMAKLLKGYGVKTDIATLPTGIDLKKYAPMNKPDVRKKLGFDTDTIYILYVGRLAGEKNVVGLIRDFGRVQVRNPHVHLVIAGDGPERKAYEQIVKTRGLSANITFLGLVPHEHLIDYFIGADIFAFPSQTDTEGIVLIEAMASGTACVVYDCLGPGDIIKQGESGLKASPVGDQFFQHLLEVVEDKPLREKLGIGGLREVRKYSIEKTTDQMEELYNALIEHKSSRS